MTDFWNVVDDTVTSTRNNELQKRKDERMALCGNAGYAVEKPNGSRKITRWYCKDSRCPKCNERRGIALREKVVMALQKYTSLSYIRLQSNLAAKLCKTLGQNLYIKIPQENDECDIFFVPDEPNPSMLVTEEFISEFDWTQCATIIPGHITSGKLVVTKEVKESHSGPFLFNVQDIIASPYDVVEFAYKATAAEVITWRQPSSKQENQSFRDYFSAIFIKNISANGGKILQILYLQRRSRSLELNFIDLELENSFL